MAGLLDFLETPAGQGLLAATFAGLAGARRGQPMNTLGAAGLGGIAGYSNALNMGQERQRNEMQNKTLALQLKQLEQAQADKEAMRSGLLGVIGTPQQGQAFTPDRFDETDNPFAETAQGVMAPGGGYMGATPDFKPGTGMVGRGQLTPDMASLLAIPGMESKALELMIPKRQDPKFETYFDPETGQERRGWVQPNQAPVPVGGAKAPEQKQTDLARLIAERDSLPPGHPARPTYDAAIRKASTHQQPVSISLGGPQAVINPVTGLPELAQFPNKPGASPVFTGLKPAPEAGKPPTEGETKAAFYVQNMKAASKTLTDLEKKGFDPTKTGEQISTAVAGGVGNILVNKMAQQAKQAQDQWSEQMLRMQTGAAATADEIARTRRTYFPVTGDSADTVELKRQMREQAESGVYSAAGRAQGRVPSGASGGWSIKKVP